MLKIIFEYRKGILFVRLNGRLNMKTVAKFNHDVIDMVKKNGITNVVINMSNLKEIDFRGINSLFYIYELVRNSKGKLVICEINNLIKERIKKSHLLNYTFKIDNELEAYSLIKI